MDDYNWELLEGPAGHIRAGIVAEWESLLNDDQLAEEAYHSFLARHSGFFFCDAYRRPLAVSKLTLGADFTTDFVVPTDHSSVGWSYTFIEIESPHSPPFTKSGRPSARLVQALHQVVTWRSWIAEHPDASRMLLGEEVSSRMQFTVGFEIVIGTRGNTTGSLRLRNQWAVQNGVSIRSFDSLTEAARERHFSRLYADFSSELRRLDARTKNQLANPFASAYSDQEWRRIVHNERFCSGVHMVALNADLLLKGRRYSEKLADFTRFVDEAA